MASQLWQRLRAARKFAVTVKAVRTAEEAAAYLLSLQ